MEDKNELYAWMAGFVDGEGSIGICSVGKNKQYAAKLTVCNTNKESVDIFTKEFGGKTRLRNYKSERKIKWKPCYEWQVTNLIALNAISKLRKYLKIKNKQADIVLELGKLKSLHSGAAFRWDKVLKADMYSKYAVLKSKVQLLNKRGL